MGLRATVAAALSQGFTALGDVVEACSYVPPKGSSNYNPTTGVVTGSGLTYTTSAVFTGFSLFEVANSAAEPSDVKVLIQQSALSVRPVIGGEIVRSDSARLRILGVEEDPAAVLWTLHTREP
jgi:hypothetical protein